MTPFVTIITIICVVGISTGQLLFKKAALAIPDAAGWQAWAFNPWLVGALFLYAVTTVGWIWVLRHVPLHLAYPFMGLAFLIVPCLSLVFLGEPIRWPTLVGGALILAGITIAARAA